MIKVKTILKNISVKNLVSGDQEIRILLIVDPRDADKVKELMVCSPEQEFLLTCENDKK